MKLQLINTDLILLPVLFSGKDKNLLKIYKCLHGHANSIYIDNTVVISIALIAIFSIAAV